MAGTEVIWSNVLVDDAGVQHNLELADRVLRESLDHIGLAYRLSAQFPPAAPDLGMISRCPIWRRLGFT